MRFGYVSGCVMDFVGLSGEIGSESEILWFYRAMVDKFLSHIESFTLLNS
jgi:hypothetical protein